MASRPKGQVVPHIAAIGIEAVGVGEVSRIPVRRAEKTVDRLALRDRHAPDLDILGRKPHAGLHGRFPPHRLLDGSDQQRVCGAASRAWPARRRISFPGARRRHPLRNLGMRQRRPQRIADHRLRGLDAAEEHHQQIRHHFRLGKRISPAPLPGTPGPVRVRVALQRGEHRPLGHLPLRAQKRGHVLPELPRRRLPPRPHRRIAGEVLQRGGEVVVPPEQRVPVPVRQPEHTADAPHRERPRDPATQISALSPAHVGCRAPQVAHQPVEHSLHRRQQALLQPPPPERADEAPLVPDLRVAVGGEHVRSEDVADRRPG